MPLRYSRLKYRVLLVLGLAVSAVAAYILLAGLPVGHGGLRPAAGDGRPPGLPGVMLWAWERPERLDFIDPRQVGVAFLARTLFLRGEEVIVRPRLQPLRIPPGTVLSAVVRIESDRSEVPALSPSQREKAIAAILPVIGLPGIVALQVDFEARASERPFLRDLVTDLRQRIPSSLALSMTALASWCLHDNWLAGLPVNEVVPMLFRMGPGGVDVLPHLEAGRDFRPGLCRHSLGIATDEPMPKIPRGRRVYVFHPRPWSGSALEQTLKGVPQWPSGLDGLMLSF